MKQPEPDELVRGIARFVSRVAFADLDEGTLTAAKKLLLDALGAGIAGSHAAGCLQLREVLEEIGGKPEASVIGGSIRLPAHVAGTVNGAMCRALEFDDVFEAGLMHTTATVVPAALAAAQASGRTVTGREALTAVVVGIELANRLSLAATAPRRRTLRPRVMSTTYQVSYFTAAAVASHLWRLSEDQVVHALGLAYSQVAGNQQAVYDHALTVRVQQGLSTGAGLLAARLARAGISGSTRSFEGQAGYFTAYWDGLYDRGRVLDRLGEEFSVDQVSLKPYPSCKFTHNAIVAALEIRRQRPVRADEVKRVEVRVPSGEYFNLVCSPLGEKQRPTNVVEAQFSMPYAVAVALHRGKPTLEAFQWPGLGSEPVLELAAKVQPVLVEIDHETLPAPTEVSVEFRDGSLLLERCEVPPGHPLRPLAWPAVLEKFRTLARYPPKPLPTGTAEVLATTVPTFETVDNVEEWVSEALQW